MLRVYCCLLFVLCPLASLPAAAQARASVIEGVVTTQGGTIRLPGALVVVRDSNSQEVATTLSEGDGRFRIVALPGGSYTIVVTLEGFAMAHATATLGADKATELAIDLPIATMTQAVEVIAPASRITVAETIGSAAVMSSKEAEQLAPGAGLGGALRLLASVIEVPGGASIKGGRPAQAGMQMGASTLTDPVLGLVHVMLPDIQPYGEGY